MQDAKNTVIYVGKAKALKNRVSQYFANLASHTEKTRAMVSQIDHFDVIVADSEFEALVLENALIKRHQPHYNILLKDGKGYPYVRLSVQDAYPRFSLVGKVAEDGARYFGPFASRGNTQAILDAICAALRLPTCALVFPRDIGKGRPCLNYHMGRCDGDCRKDMDQSRYGEAIEQAVRLLEGKFQEVGEEIRAEMERAAEELRFERAAQLRDRYRAIELLGKRQKVVAGSLADTDVVGFHRGEAKSCFVVLHYVDGELAAKDWDLLETPMEEDEGDVTPRWSGASTGAGAICPGRSCCPVSWRTRCPSPGCSPNRPAGGCISSRPSGGPRWISSAWPPRTPWRRWPGPPPGRSGRAGAWSCWESSWICPSLRTASRPTTSPTPAATTSWPP